MRLLSAVLLAILTLLPIAASAQTTGIAVMYNLRDCGISSLSGSSQSIAVADPNRKYLGVFNTGNATIYLNLAGGTAANTGIASVAVTAGSSIVMKANDGIPRNAITVIGTAAQPVACFEGN